MACKSQTFICISQVKWWEPISSVFDEKSIPKKFVNKPMTKDLFMPLNEFVWEGLPGIKEKWSRQVLNFHLNYTNRSGRPNLNKGTIIEIGTRSVKLEKSKVPHA